MKIIAISLMLALLTSCSSIFIDDEVLRTAIEKDLHASLALGDSREKIERVLTEKKIPFSFDRFQNRYVGCIRPKEKRMVERAVCIDIDIDATRCLKKIEVTNSYTFF
jgi:hypothetical protein